MRKYPKYKTSGIDWLGEVPSDWGLNRLASFGRFSKGSGISKSNLTEQGIPVILYGDIYTKYNLRTNKIINFISKELASVSKLIVRGDILFTGSGETREDIGKCIVYFGNEEVYAGGDTIIFSPKSNDSLFLAYSLNSNFVIDKKAMDSKGDIIVHIYASSLRNIFIPLPPLPEQHAIVRFLDYKTGQIDSFIANRQKQIELLKEQKAGIINKAVTKGINPNAKMKDSGIEWIGLVPEHWEIWKVKHTSYVKGRIGWDGLRSDEFFENEYAFLVTGTDFIEGKVNWKTCYQITKERYLQDKHIQLKEDDLLITKDGTIGKTAVVKGLVGYASLNSGVFVVRPLRKYISDYLYFILNSNVFTQFINITTTGTTILHLYQNIFEIFEFTIPPIEEQYSIVNYINEESIIIDTLISKYQKQIDLMQEYRTSLISQAVTGKIDVREWHPKKAVTA